MKRSLLTLTVIFALLISGCGKYSSSYRATLLISSNEKQSAFMDFSSFTGTKVFKLKSTGDGDIDYTVSLGSGSATVYYDYIGTKEELCKVNGGDSLDLSGGFIGKGTVYIIVETDGKCEDGKFSFKIE